MRARLIRSAIVVIIGIAIAARIDSVGLRDFFNQQRCFAETGLLDETIAVELSRRTLELDGIAVELKLDSVKVYDDGWRAVSRWRAVQYPNEYDYTVVLRKRPDGICCRALHSK